MTYIEVLKGEKPGTIFKERLQRISELHKQRRGSSMSPFEFDMTKIQEIADKSSEQSTPTKEVSYQTEIDHDSAVEGTVQEQNEKSEVNKGNQYNEERSNDDDGVNDFDTAGLNSNANNNNFNIIAVGERIIVQHNNRFLFGCIRYIGRVSFTDKEQIGIELDQAYGERLYKY